MTVDSDFLSDAFALSPMQEGMLYHALNADSQGTYFEQNWCDLEGDLNPALLQWAWHQLIRRHGVLRSQFIWQGLAKAQQVQLPIVYPKWSMFDWQAHTSEQQESEFVLYLAADRKSPFAMQQAPLMRFALMRLGEQQHRFLWTYHHILLDGWCAGQLVGELLAIYQAASQAYKSVDAVCDSQALVALTAEQLEGLDATLNLDATLAQSLPKRRPYRDFIDYLANQDKSAAKAYWQGLFAGRNIVMPTPLPLPQAAHRLQLAQDRAKQDSPKPETTADAADFYGEMRLICEADFTAQLQQFCRRQRLTLSTVLQGAWAFLLHTYSQEQAVVLGVTVAGRPTDLSASEQMMGLFLNSLPVLADCQAGETLLAYLHNLQAQLRQSEQFSASHLADIASWARSTQAEQNTAQQTAQQTAQSASIFDALLIVENLPFAMPAGAKAESMGELTISAAASYERTSVPLSLKVHPGEKLSLLLNFDQRKVCADVARQMLPQMQSLLAQICLCEQNSEMRLRQLHVYDAKQQAAILATANIDVQELKDVDLKDFINQFLRQCAHNPNAAALSMMDASSSMPSPAWSYGDLAKRSGVIAKRISDQLAMQQRSDPSKQVIVAVLLERSETLVASLLAIMRLGACYIPLDPSYPSERLAMVFEDAQPDLILLDPAKHNDQSAHLELANKAGIAHIILDALDVVQGEQGEQEEQGEDDSAQSLEAIEPLYTADPAQQLAYIIFTSGSTGRPKGVAISQRNLSNFIQSMCHTPGITDADRVLAVTTIAFDIAVLELLAPLSVGAQVVIASRLLARDAKALVSTLEHDISVMQATPATYKMMLEADWPAYKAASLRLLVGGEALESSLARALMLRCDQLWNMYGPTETTVWSAVQAVEPAHLDGAVATIGGPIDRTGLLVVDEDLRPVPDGVEGELLISGAGLSPGYWQRDALTKEKFVELNAANGVFKAYRTGDLVKRLSSGQINFIGRADGQIKLRGYRIELGEIEAALSAIDGLAEAVVIVVQSQQQAQLLACLRVIEGISQAFINTLHQKLSETLPEFMLPSAYLELAQMPLTPNLKVDRKALAAMDSRLYLRPELTVTEDADDVAVIANDALATLVKQIWQQVLFDQAESQVSASSIHQGSDFFALGGHSLLATRMIALLNDALELELTVNAIFSAPRFVDFVRDVQHARNLRKTGQSGSRAQTANRPKLVKTQALACDQVSFAQQRLALMQRLGGAQASAYVIPLAVELKGKLNLALLEQSLAYIVAKHEQLRARFEFDQDNGVAVSITPVAQTLALKCSEISADALDAALAAQAEQGFDLQNGPLWRAHVWQLAPNQHVLSLVLHHIVADEWSLNILLKDCLAYYQDLISNLSPAANLSQDLNLSLHTDEQAPITYCDYATWQRQLDLSEALDYWREQLANAPQLLELPTDFVRPSEASYQGQRYHFAFSDSQSAAINRLCAELALTPYMLLLSVFKVLLFRYSAQSDLCVGSPVATRSQSELHGLVGLFVNTVVMRNQLHEAMSFADLSKAVRATSLAAFAQQELPFEQLLDELKLGRSMAFSPLFQVFFAYQDLPEAKGELDSAQLQWKLKHNELSRAKFDLSLSCYCRDGIYQGSFEYATDLFKAQSITRMAEHFANLLDAFASDSQQAIANAQMLSRHEAEHLYALGQGPQLDMEAYESVHHCFMDMMHAYPANTAIAVADTRLSYAQVGATAELLARQLQAAGIQAGDAVGLWTDYDPKVYIAMLAIAKCGATYVPLARDYPLARVAYIASDAQIRYLIAPAYDSSEAIMAGLHETLTDVQEISLAAFEIVAHEQAVEIIADAAIAADIVMDTPLYLLYTSGSTGKPKGVLAPHRGVIRLVKDCDYCVLDEQQVILQVVPMTFDVSAFEIWGALLNGGTLAMMDHGEVSMANLGAAITRHQVSTIWLTAGLFHVVVDEQIESLRPLQQLIAGGDRLSVSHIRKVVDVLPDTRMINGYGPTEATTFACAHTINAHDINSQDMDFAGSPPIGRPINETQAYVLDASGNVLPTGVPGELCLGGQGVALGYLNRPEQTAEAFVPNPFVDTQAWDIFDHDLCLYRTGDQVRMDDQGCITFLGRLDGQVKIRGFRIELGEIELALQDIQGIQDAVVVIHSSDGAADNKRLLAYIIGDSVDAANQTALSDEQLSQSLLSVLPDYMVPSAYIWLETMPLNDNGKVDRKRLPKPDLASNTVYRAAQTETEKALLALWLDVLGVADAEAEPQARGVGVEDNFFDLGGDSIKAIQIVGRLNQVGLVFEPKALFQHQTVASLSQFLVQLMGNEQAVENALKRLLEVSDPSPNQTLSPSPSEVEAFDLVDMDDVDLDDVISQLDFD